MNPINYDKTKTLASNVQDLFKFVNWVCREMSDGRVPMNKSELQGNIDTVNETQSIAFVTLAEGGAIDDVTASEHPSVFAEWESGVAYKQGNLRRYSAEMGEMKLYRCLQDHTSQADWTPDVSVSLWKLTSDPSEEFPEWSQPIGAGDAYNKGDKVSYQSKHYVSDVDNNVWQPTVYGWSEVE